MDSIPDKNIHDAFQTIVQNYDQLTIKVNDQDAFNKLARVEGSLVSSYSKNSKSEQYFQTIVIYYADHLIGAISFFVAKNEMRKVKNNLYERIDIVVVPKRFRGNGISKALVLLAIHYCNISFGNRIYSISCLAAHEAISRVLDGLNFRCNRGNDENFSRHSIYFDPSESQEYAKLIEENLKSAIHRINYKLHKEIGSIKS
ncbi:MAG: hypothetical protein BM556_10600 [Bacteriovorax sp. MedPE-SWde]|nr:MAG: hypothetical protein BM556_10600 [Bacteriovorax sp. MedPE-SWde]